MASQVPQRASGSRKAPQRPSSQRSPSPRPGAPRQGKQSTFKAARRRRQQMIALGAVLVVVAAAIVVIAVKVAGGSSSSGSGADTRSAISASALDDVLDVPVSAMQLATTKISLSSYPIAVKGAALTSAGLPQLLYIGAEYCPFCAGERWSMVMALNQFGHFTGLRSIVSDPNDAALKSVPTFTFYQSTYTSSLLSFESVEQQTVSGKTLETPTKVQEAALDKYDNPPYTQQGGIPFMDYGGRYIQDGINYNDTSLSHQSFDAVASQLGGSAGPQTAVAGSIAATAGVIISHLCQLTGGKSLNDNAACRAFPTPISKPPTA